jgi:LysM repeat protein
MVELGKLGVVAIPALEQALIHGDYQTRQAAANLLCRLVRDEKAYIMPSQQFLKILVEGMAHDQYPSYSPTLLWVRNAENALSYFRAHPQQVLRAAPYLEAGMLSTDGQQRLLSAVLLAEHGTPRYPPQVAEVLSWHLADNRLGSDATLAAPALVALGETSRPWLEHLRDIGDQQQQTYAKRILRHLDRPSASPGEGRRLSSMYGWEPEDFPNPDGTYSRPPRPLPVVDHNAPPIRYMVIMGDTVTEVARLFIVSPESIAELNGLEVDAKLEPGQMIQIPPIQQFQPKPEVNPNAKPILYTVTEGDTLREISKLFIVSRKSLAELNGLNIDTPLEPGRTIQIPPSGL